MEFPKYTTIAGQRFPVGSIGENDTRYRIANTNMDECKEYASNLEKEGFLLRMQKEIPSGGKGVNVFYEYVKQENKNNIRAYVFWDASIYTTFITFEVSNRKQDDLLFDKSLAIANKDDLSPVMFTQLQIEAGMCYIVQTRNDEFILVDGGAYNERDEKRLYEFLTENTQTNCPQIALWIFTHSHDDHIGLATHFISSYKDKVNVKAFAYQFPDCDKITVSMESVFDMKKDIELLERTIRNSYPKADIYPLHTGESFFLPGVEIEILWSLDDTYPSYYFSFNDMSAALRIKPKHGKTVMILGDCMHEACRRIAHTYGEYLKSDILQVTHHGLIGGDTWLYELIDPKICCWSISEERFTGQKANQRYQWCLGEGGCDYNSFLRDDAVCVRKHYCMKENVTIEL